MIKTFSGWRHTEKTKRRMSKASKGKKKSKSHVLNISKSHNTKKYKKEVSKRLRGRKFSKETRDKLSKAKKGNKHHKGFKHSKEVREKISKAKLGSKHSKDSKEKMSIAHKGFKHSKETKEKMSKVQGGKIVSEKAKKNMSLAQQKYHNQNTVSKDTRKKISKAKLGKKKSKETKKKMSKAAKILWEDKNHVKKMLPLLWNSSKSGPKNKQEWVLHRILMKLYPKMWWFVGDGKVVIGTKIPDFVHTRFYRAIEMFGSYWHGEKITGQTNSNHVQQRKRYFAKYGYKLVVIWEHELCKGEEYIKNKLVKGFKTKIKY